MAVSIIALRIAPLVPPGPKTRDTKPDLVPPKDPSSERTSRLCSPDIFTHPLDPVAKLIDARIPLA